MCALLPPLDIAVLLAFLCATGFSQSSPAAGPWTGWVQCDGDIQNQGYQRQETQTWTLTSRNPTGMNGDIIHLYSASWSASGQGKINRTDGSRVIASQWTVNAPAINVQLAIFVRPDHKLVIRQWGTRQHAEHAVTGTRQVSVNGAQPTSSPIDHATYEWIFPHIHDSPSNARISGSNVAETDSPHAELMPQLAPQHNATCKWEFARGANASVPPPPGGTVASNPPAETPTPPATGLSPINVTISSPPNGESVNNSAVAVSGTVDDPHANVTVNGVSATVSGTSFLATVLLAPGTNTLVAVATNSNGATGTTSRQITLNVTPSIAIDSPADNSVTTEATVTVTGHAAQGGPTTQPPTVTVNGIVAQLNNGAFIANVPLAPGANSIQAQEVDNGLSATANLTVTRQAPVQLVLLDISGSGQSAPIQTQLPNPLTLALGVAGGSAGMPNVPVTFRVTSQDGLLAVGSAAGASSITVNTDASGRVSVNFTVGSQVGDRNNIVAASSAGFATVLFQESATAKVISQVSPNAGAQGATNLSVTLTGDVTHFVQNATSADFGPGITLASPLTVNSATSATALLNIDPQATAGPHTVTLNTGAEIATLANGFTVNIPMVLGPPIIGIQSLPSVTQVSPNTAVRGATNVSVTLTGFATSWVNSSTKADFGPGITLASPLTINSATSATALLNVDLTAALGTHAVALTTGTQVAKLSNGFTVTAPVTSGQYRIAINGFRVNNETNAGAFGEHNAVYAAAAVEVLDRKNSLAVLQSPMMVRSKVHGDTRKDPNRVQAGSFPPSGGFLAGDMVPAGQDPASTTLTPNSFSFPLLLWQGQLSDGVEAVVVRPTLWVWNGRLDAFDPWSAIVTNTVIGWQRDTREMSTINNRIGSADISPFRDTQSIVDCESTADLLPTNCKPGSDRPIGLTDCNNPSYYGYAVWCDLVVVVTREALEKALASPYQAGGVAKGVVPIHLADNGSAWNGNYDLYLRVERVP